MTLKIFDTLSRSKTEFRPIDPNHIKIYVCGPTVYDLPHIGNARPVVVFDVLVRLLRQKFPKVTYVRNITDVDDKINARSLESGESISSITQRTTDIFQEDMAELMAVPPDKEPRATAHLEEMKDMIETLINKGHAYETRGHVLFNVASMNSYGQLSRLHEREIIAGARIDVAPFKRNPQDYVLWKPSQEPFPGWESPWGRGRPGWHIECSAMSLKHLGASFDIHGGGQDLIFPHHENELAQSKCALGETSFAKYWMHNGYLLSEGEKMSKSLGNFYTVRELLQSFPGEAIRFLLLKTHYRQPLNFTKEKLTNAKVELTKFYQTLRALSQIPRQTSDIDKGFEEALHDDMNSPLAISKLHKILRQLKTVSRLEEKTALKSQLLESASLLGLLQQNPDSWFKASALPVSGKTLDSPTIEALISKREKARGNKQYKESDEIRDQLLANGILLEDNPSGTLWRRK